ncbi:MAG: hypothetical protein QXX51_03880 [Candidatus Bathyarchaeia archaeon]
MSESVPYGRYEEAYKAIHSALSGLMAAPPGKKITKLEFAWNPDGTVSAIKAYMHEELVFSLTFSWNSDGTLKEVART